MKILKLVTYLPAFFIAGFYFASQVYAATALYRSVGNTASDLNTNSRTVEISGTTATFNDVMPNNVGVGDVLQYQVASTYYVAFISGRTSSTVYTIQSQDGTTVPTACSTGTAVTVYRAHLYLDDWEDQIVGDVNPSIHDDVDDTVLMPNMNLTASNTVAMIACYSGDSVDSKAVNINGWTTDEDNYIKVYTPTSTSEVGVSQRHSGKWDETKYRLEVIVNDSVVTALNVGDNYVRIDGLQGKITNSTGTSIYIAGIKATGSDFDVGDNETVISNNILKGVLTNSAVTSGIRDWWGTEVTKVYNNIVYDFKNSNDSRGIALRALSYVYNNTVYNCDVGIRRNDEIVITKNNISYNNTDNYAGSFSASSTNNLTGSNAADGAWGVAADSGITDGAATGKLIDAGQDFPTTVKVGMIVNRYSTYTYVTAVDSDSQLSVNDDIFSSGQDYTIYTNRYATVTFVNTTSGSEDFHLASIDTGAMDYGTSSVSEIGFTDDIDGQTRSGDWDIGADEFINTAPDAPASIGQYLSDCSTPLSTSTFWTSATTLCFKGSISDSNTNDWVKLQLELSTSTLTNSPNYTASSYATSTATSSISVSSLSDGQYRWQASSLDYSSATSSFTQYNSGSLSFGIDTQTPDILAIDAGASSTDRTSLTSDAWFNYSDTGSDDQLSFSWTDPGSLSDDTFYYELNSTSTDSIDGTESTTTNPYIDSITIAEGSSYFHVKPKNGAGTWGTERTFTIKYDKSAPTSGSISYTDGYYTAASVAITYTLGSDADSGLNVSTGKIQRKEAVLSAGTCASFGSWSDLATESDGSYTDTAVVSGKCYQYQYLISDNVLNQAEYTTTSTAKIDASAPTSVSITSITENPDSSYQYATSTNIIYYSAATSSGSFIVNATGTDPESDIQKFNFPSLAGFAPTNGGDDASPPYSWTYNWTNSSTQNGSADVTAYNNLDSTTTASFYVYLDTQAPSSGSISYTDGYYTAASVAITYTLGSDADSGLNVSTGKIQRKEAVLSAGTCASFGSWSDLATESDGSYTDAAVVSGKCYQYQYLISDNVSNQAEYTTTSTAKIDASAPISVSITSITADSSAQLTIYATATDSVSGLHSAPYWFSETSNHTGSSSSTDWQAQTSFTDTGLSPNTQYTYKVKARDSAANESSYSATSSLYTLANIPSDLTLTADSQVQITASWSSNSNSENTEYYIENSTQGTNSSWQTSTTWSSSGLSCATSYSFRVKARNRDNAETSYTSLSTLSTGDCAVSGGGGLPPEAYMLPLPPLPTKDNPQGRFNLIINQGSPITDKRTVSLKLFAGSNVKTMGISLSSDFKNSVQTPYQEQIQWDLCQNNAFCLEGKYTLYVKFFTRWGQPSPVVSSHILFSSSSSSSLTQADLLKEQIRQIQLKIIQALLQLTKLLQGRLRAR